MSRFEEGQEVVVTEEIVNMYGQVGKRGKIMHESHISPGWYRVQVFFDGTQSDDFTIDGENLQPIENFGPQPAQPVASVGGDGAPETEAEVDAYLRQHGYDPDEMVMSMRHKLNKVLFDQLIKERDKTVALQAQLAAAREALEAAEPLSALGLLAQAVSSSVSWDSVRKVLYIQMGDTEYGFGTGNRIDNPTAKAIWALWRYTKAWEGKPTAQPSATVGEGGVAE